MKKMKFIPLTLLALLPVTPAAAQSDRPATPPAVRVTVTNPIDLPRREVIRIDGASVLTRLEADSMTQIVAYAATGYEIPCQPTSDGGLLLPATVLPNATTTITLRRGTPQTFPALCTGRIYPERLDDMAWENDCVAYRLYGPALQRTGERAYGFDVWTKATTRPVMEERYHKELTALPEIARLIREGKRAEANRLRAATSLHIDHGDGMDCYSVGPTLGGGAPALLIEGDSLSLPWCYATARVVDSGPLRFTVHLTYPARRVGRDAAVVETRTISLDRGSHFNRATVSYTGLSAPATAAAGLVVHSKDTTTLSFTSRSVAYADPTDNPRAQQTQIYLGLLFPDTDITTRRHRGGAQSGGIAGHAIGVKDGLRDGQSWTYYFGSAWSAATCHSFDEWQLHMRNTLRCIDAPLVVKY